MPWKLVPPTPGRNSSYKVRGSYLGITLDRSTRTVDEAIAKKILARWDRPSGANLKLVQS
jgi:hypothetical protein